jgi:uncharacterized membrane protein YdjX (TVP38/TMEM64 family)
MRDSDLGWSFIIGLFIGMIIGVILLSMIFNPTEIGYKRGQIDALIGNIKYELVINPDSTRTWEKINEN